MSEHLRHRMCLLILHEVTQHTLRTVVFTVLCTFFNHTLMKKLLVILDGRVIPDHVTNAAVELAGTIHAGLHVVFVNTDPAFEAYDYVFPNDLVLTSSQVTKETVEEEDDAILRLNRQLFTDICDRTHTRVSIEPEKHIMLEQLLALSAFSDCILTDATEHLNQFHLVDLLTKARCPVYLVPKEAGKVENIILTYDGSFASIHAIKQFARIFPEWHDKSTSLVYIAQDGQDEFPREKNIQSWLTENFSNARFTLLKGDLQEELVNYVRSVPHSLVVMGSFSRSAVSRLFHKSLANAVIRDGQSALFIAHP